VNAMERMLSDDLARAIDRLATSIPEGSLERIRTVTPTLAARLADIETGLAGARAALVADYARAGHARSTISRISGL
jgi:CRP-like cAMP-binding protein